MRHPVTLALLVSTLALPAAAQHTVLLELFTSEGCSSCPPADKLLQQLNGTRTAKGDLVVVLSEHVTYWNSLGWRDPFSTETSTSRQQAYGDRFHNNEVYTPQMVVNGEAEVLGSDARAINTAISNIQHSTPAIVRILSAKASGKDLAVSFTLTGATAPLDIYAVVSEDAASTAVPRGENSGRTLTHVSIANSLTKVATLSSSAEKTIHVATPADGHKRHLLLFAQSPNLGPVVSTDAVPL